VKRADIITVMRTITSMAVFLVALSVSLPAAAVTRALIQEKPADVAGNWAITVETQAGGGTPTLTLKQDGETLTGTYSSQVFGEQKVDGTVKGNAITFGFTASVEGTTIKVTYTGTVESTSMKGKVSLGELGEGTFTAKKQ
jgi:hypothetical protein